MKRLTIAQELEIIKNIKNGEYMFLDAGSTRATFAMDDSRVVKLTVEEDYVAQNMNEIEIAAKDNGVHTTKIYEYGKYIIIAERVEPIYLSDYEFDYEKDGVDVEDEDRLYNKDILRQGNEVTNFLEGLDICPDGEQYGLTKDGRVVSYDYGYSDAYEHESQVGNVSEWDAEEMIAEANYSFN